jgi:hypothetical protein
MLTWSGVGLLACAVALGGRWLLRPRDALGRSKPFPAVSVLLLVGLAAGCLVPVYRHHRLEARLEAAASALVGVPVAVHCQTAGQQFVDVGAELGFVRYGPGGVPERATLIKRDQCSDLADYLGSDKASPSRDQAVAVHVLSHEARHMAGITSEAVAECGAVQRDARAAELLGAEPDQALRLARLYWKTVYPRMADGYRSADCRPAGPLDEGLPGAPWSTSADPSAPIG